MSSLAELPSQYAVDREKRRRASRRFGFVFVVGFGVASGLRDGYVGGAIVGSMVAALVLALLLVRIHISRHLDLSEDQAQEAVVPALVPAFTIAGDGPGPRSTQNTTTISGRLRLTQQGIDWKKSSQPKGRNSATVQWLRADLRTIQLYKIASIIPICLLHLDGARGTGDIWIRRPPEFVAKRLAEFGLPGTIE